MDVVEQPPFLEGLATLELLRRLPNIKYLKMNDFFLPSEREIEVLCHFTRLEWLEMYEVMFNATADLLDLISQLVNLKVLHIADMEIRSHTSEDLIGPTLLDFVDAVPKRLRNLKLQDPTESLYIFSGFQEESLISVISPTSPCLGDVCRQTATLPCLNFLLTLILLSVLSVLGSSIYGLTLKRQSSTPNSASTTC